MKINVTAKQLRGLAKHEFRAPYAELQKIFRGVEPDFYTAGRYGWNFDAYYDKESSVLITTGYRNTFGRQIPHELIEHVEKHIEAVERGTSNYESTFAMLDAIRKAFFRGLADYDKTHSEEI